MTAYSNVQLVLGAEYVLLEQAPTSGRADLPLFLPLQVRNTGNAQWRIYGGRPVLLSYHWYTPTGQIVEFDGRRTSLPVPLAPNEAVAVELYVEPPPHAGDFVLEIDLVEEGVGWFSQRGVEPLRISLQIAPEPEGPRASIVSSLCLPTDAVGNTIVSQMRYLQALGYRTIIITEDVDQRHPAELRQYMAALSLEDVLQNRYSARSRRALKHLRESDIVIFHYAITYRLFEAIADLQRGVILFDYHGVTPAHLWNITEQERANLIASQRQFKLLRHADYAIVHSSYIRDELESYNVIPPERILVLPLYAPLERFRPGPRSVELAERYGIGPDQPVLLYVGRISSNKRIDDVVRALALIRQQRPNTMLLLVGDNRSEIYARQAEDILRLAKELGQSDHVIFTGQVDDDTLVKHYQFADLFVTASLHEGFCIPVIEAMASGLPVIGAHTTALPETIGNAGLTFTPQDPADLANTVLRVLETQS